MRQDHLLATLHRAAKPIMASLGDDMYDSETCNECSKLFLEPEHLRIFFSASEETETLAYRRNVEGVKATAALGCAFCRTLEFFSRGPLSPLDDFQLIS